MEIDVPTTNLSASQQVRRTTKIQRKASLLQASWFSIASTPFHRPKYLFNIVTTAPFHTATFNLQDLGAAQLALQTFLKHSLFSTHPDLPPHSHTTYQSSHYINKMSLFGVGGPAPRRNLFPPSPAVPQNLFGFGPVAPPPQPSLFNIGQSSYIPPVAAAPPAAIPAKIIEKPKELAKGPSFK